MILNEGIHKFVCKNPSLLYASVSAPDTATVEVLRNGVREDYVYVSGPSHTWWNSNPLFNPALKPDDQIEFRITGPCSMRFECDGCEGVDNG